MVFNVPESTDANKFERYQIFQKRKADLDGNVEEYTNRMKRKLEVMVFNVAFNNISVISWQSVLLVEETGVP
jgi:hypothetical protein